MSISFVPLKKAISVNKTEGHTTGLTLSWCVSSFIFHFEAASPLKMIFSAFCPACLWENGHRNMIWPAAVDNIFPVNATKLTD